MAVARGCIRLLRSFVRSGLDLAHVRARLLRVHLLAVHVSGRTLAIERIVAVGVDLVGQGLLARNDGRKLVDVALVARNLGLHVLLGRIVALALPLELADLLGKLHVLQDQRIAARQGLHFCRA